MSGKGVQFGQGVQFNMRRFMKMLLLIEAPKSYEKYFDELAEMDDADVIISYSKNLSGGEEFVEIAVFLAPALLAVIEKILKTILHHIQEMKRIEKENPDEVQVTIKKSDFDIDVVAKTSAIDTKTNVEKFVETIIDKLKAE